MVLVPETIEMFVGYSIASFAIGYSIAFIFKTFRQFGEKL